MPLDVSSTRCKAFVVIESPFAGDLETNLHYADALMYDALGRNEAPFLGHLLYPRVFDDADPLERELGIRAHLAVLERADYVVVGLDLGSPTNGMRMAIAAATELGKPIVERHLGRNWKETAGIRPTLGFCVAPYGVVAQRQKFW